MRGRVVTEVLGFDGGRAVSVHLPSRTPELLVVAGDGALVTPWGADLERPDLPATVVVGVHRAVDETQRLHEYSPPLDPERFALHEAFLLDEVVPWAQQHSGVRLPASRTAAFGVSAGGELALALGLRHPDVVGTVLCASPGAGYVPPGVLPDRLPRTYLLAGTDEPFFLDNARRWHTALLAAGSDAVVVERPGGHGGPFWRAELPRMVAWAAGAPPVSERRR